MRPFIETDPTALIAEGDLIQTITFDDPARIEGAIVLRVYYAKVRHRLIPTHLWVFRAAQAPTRERPDGRTWESYTATPATVPSRTGYAQLLADFAERWPGFPAMGDGAAGPR